jgi:hypothetical protein
MLTREGAKLGDQFRSRLLEKLHVFDWFDPTHPLIPLGIYGEISYSVSRQSQEIGIRMALGASVARVQLSVIAQTLRLTLLVVGIGGVASFAVARGSPLCFSESSRPIP